MSSDYGLGSATGKCPQGTKAVSGGFDNPDFDVDFSGMGQTGLIGYESRRQGKRKWTASALNLGDDSGELRVQANCREGEKLKRKQRSEEIDATGGAELAEVTARCAKKQRVISGGFSSSDPIDAGGSELALVYGSRKQGKRQWTVSAVLTGEETITASPTARRSRPSELRDVGAERGERSPADLRPVAGGLLGRADDLARVLPEAPQEHGRARA
jgi:hypothetical protein